MGKKLASDIPGLEFGMVLEGAASGATNTDQEVGYFVAPFDLKITGAYISFKSAFTGAATNYPKMSLINRSNSDAEMAALSFSSTGVKCGAKDSVAMNLSDTAANLLASKGDVITYNIAQQGNGKAYPANYCTLIFERQ